MDNVFEFLKSLAALRRRTPFFAEPVKKRDVDDCYKSDITTFEDQIDYGSDEEDVKVLTPRMARSFSVLMEFKHLKENPPSGMIVCPSLNDMLIWEVVLFLRQGHYRGAILKLIMKLPEDYPDAAPSVTVLNRPVYHPLIHPCTGHVDISLAFPEWEAGRDYAVLVLAYVKKIFYRAELIGGETLNSLIVSNEEALGSFRSRFGEFTENVMKMVEQSKRDVYLRDSPSLSCGSSSIAFTPYQEISPSTHSLATPHRIISRALRNMPDRLSEQEKGTALVDWLVERLLPSDVAKNGELEVIYGENIMDNFTGYSSSATIVNSSRKTSFSSSQPSSSHGSDSECDTQACSDYSELAKCSSHET